MKFSWLRLPRLATNYALLSSAELLSKVLAAVAFAYMARVLGPISYGYLEFTLALVFMFTLVVDSGLSTFGAREIARNPQRAHDLLVQITLLRFLLAFLAYSILFVLSQIMNQPESVKNLTRIYGLTLFVMPLLILWVYQGQDKMANVALASIFRWSTFSAGVFLWVRGAGSIQLVPLVEALAILLAALYLLVGLLRREGLPQMKVEPREMLTILRQALPIGASEIVWAIKVYFATILLGFMVAGDALGRFGAAHRIVISLHAFVWLYFYNLLPSIARGSRRSVADLQKLMRTSIQITAWGAIFLGIIGSAFADTILYTIFGPQYQAAVPAFRVLIWLIPLALMSGHYRYVLIGYDLQGLEFISAALGALVNVVVNIILIPRLGIVGAAWALVFSEATIWAVSAVFVRIRVAPVPTLAYLRWPAAAGGVLVLLLYWLLPYSRWLAGAISAAVYAGVLIFTQPHFFRRLREGVGS